MFGYFFIYNHLDETKIATRLVNTCFQHITLLTLEGKQIKINSITSKTLNSQTNSGFYFGKTWFNYVHL